MPLVTGYPDTSLDDSASHVVEIALVLGFSLVPILVALRFLPRASCPAVLLSTALLLLFLNSLTSPYFRTTDASVEFYFAHRVELSGKWDQDTDNPLSSMLSITLLPPIASAVMGTTLNDFFRWVVPMVSAFVPVALFSMFSRFVSLEFAFLASYLFLSQFTFFTWTGLTVKQSTASMLLAAFLVVLFREDNNRRREQGILLLLFAGISYSHYGTSYLLLLGCIWIVVLWWIGRAIAQFSGKTVTHQSEIPFMTIVAFFVVSLGWYTITVRAAALRTFVSYLHFVADNLSGVFSFLQANSYGARLIQGDYALSLTILKALYVVLVLASVIGFLQALFSADSASERSLARLIPFAAFFLFMTVSLAIGRMAEVDPGRILYVAMFLTAPLAILGACTVARISLAVTSWVTRRVLYRSSSRLELLVVALFCVVFFMFNSGLPSEIFLRDDPGAAVGLSRRRLAGAKSYTEAEYYYRVHTTAPDVASAIWLGQHRREDLPIYADVRGGWNSLASFGGIRFDNGPIQLLYGKGDYPSLSYVYLRYFNTRYRVIEASAVPLVFSPLDELRGLEERNKIYDSDLSEVYG